MKPPLGCPEESDHTRTPECWIWCWGGVDVVDLFYWTQRLCRRAWVDEDAVKNEFDLLAGGCGDIHNESQNHTIRPRSQDYEEWIPRSWARCDPPISRKVCGNNDCAKSSRKKMKIKFCIKLKLCRNLPYRYFMPIIMASLCYLWKGGSDKVLVWPAMPTIGGVMTIGAKSPWIESPLWKCFYILAGSKGGEKTYYHYSVPQRFVFWPFFLWIKGWANFEPTTPVHKNVSYWDAVIGKHILLWNEETVAWNSI